MNVTVKMRSRASVGTKKVTGDLGTLATLKVKVVGSRSTHMKVSSHKRNDTDVSAEA